MSTKLIDVIKKVEKLPPNEQERILNNVASTWLKQFTATLQNTKNAATIVEKETANMTFCIIQLAQPEHRQLIMGCLKALAKANPFGE